jgi:hypothetical protein
MSSVSTILLQSCDENYSPFLEVSGPVNAAYAAREGHAYRQFVGHMSSQAGANFNRYHLIRDEVERGQHDWALWIDADAIVVHLNVRLESIIERTPDKFIIACRGGCEGHFDINNGIFLINLRHPLARTFADELIRKGDELGRMLTGFHSDQHEMHAWLKGHADEAGHISFLERYAEPEHNLFNYDGPFIHHVLRTDGDHETRLEKLRGLAKAAFDTWTKAENSGPEDPPLIQMGAPASDFQRSQGVLVCCVVSPDQPFPSPGLAETCRRQGIALTVLKGESCGEDQQAKTTLISRYLDGHPEWRQALVVEPKNTLFCASLREIVAKARPLMSGPILIASECRDPAIAFTLDSDSQTLGIANRQLTLIGRRVICRETQSRPCIIHGFDDQHAPGWAKYVLSPSPAWIWQHIDRIRTPDLAVLQDPQKLELRLLGLGFEVTQDAAWPDDLLPWTSCGLGIRRTPGAFADFLIWLSMRSQLDTYLETCVADGGAFIATVEYLRRFHPNLKAAGFDACRSPFLQDYVARVEHVELHPEQLTAHELPRVLRQFGQIDVAVVGGDADRGRAEVDWQLLRMHSRCIVRLSSDGQFQPESAEADGFQQRDPVKSFRI